jgi:hypothetical protein
MLFFTVVASYSMKYIYLRVYVSLLDLVALHSPTAAWGILCVIYAAHLHTIKKEQHNQPNNLIKSTSHISIHNSM